MAGTKTLQSLEQALDLIEARQNSRSGIKIGKLEMTTGFEPFNDGFEIGRWKVLAEHHLYGLANQVTRDRIGALQLAFIFQFEFSGYRRKRRIDIRNARDNHILTRDEGASLGITEDVFQTGNRQPLADL